MADPDPTPEPNLTERMLQELRDLFDISERLSQRITALEAEVGDLRLACGIPPDRM